MLHEAPSSSRYRRASRIFGGVDATDSVALPRVRLPSGRRHHVGQCRLVIAGAAARSWRFRDRPPSRLKVLVVTSGRGAQLRRRCHSALDLAATASASGPIAWHLSSPTDQAARRWAGSACGQAPVKSLAQVSIRTTSVGVVATIGRWRRSCPSRLKSGSQPADGPEVIRRRPLSRVEAT